MPLYIAIEIEGIVTGCTSTSNSQLPPTIEDNLKMIANAISAAGFLTRVHYPSIKRGSQPNSRTWNVAIAPSIFKDTLEPELSTCPASYGFELVTETFCDTDNWEEVFGLGVKSIGNAVDWKMTRSTGIHVHINPGVNGPRFVAAIKKIAILWCRFEVAIVEYMSTYCVDGTDKILSNRFNVHLYDLPMDEVYRRIIGSSSVYDLCQYLNFSPKDHPLASERPIFRLSLMTLPIYGTIEFTENINTTDPELMIKWINFLIRFVQYAVDNTVETLTSPGETLEDLDKLVPLHLA
ncbi:hypothetical protein F5884DRAFT_320831 [Xylogone sp. PMI_703]|nr:hypothetical protein F5884DRAFT_320831 [Xylogone sp. PMI_703]